MKSVNKAAAVLTAALVFAAASVPVFAADTASQKEEVIYANLNAAGTVNQTYAVNIFDGGSITDYGEYSSVKMLNTDDEIEQKGDVITFSTDADKAYYEGIMEDAQLPWNIQLQYSLDGETIQPQVLAGKDGALKIRLRIEKNEACGGTFYEDYALQVTLALDAEKCSSIEAPDAVIANAGGDKQISYTILPGKGIDTVISADVTDFEMDEIAVNGIRLNLDVDVDDDQLKDKVSKLMDAAVQLNEGASVLSSGSQKLKDGSGKLDKGAGSLSKGIKQLDQAVLRLQKGMTQVNTGLEQLNSQSASLTQGSAKVKTSLESLSEGATALQDNLGYDQYKAQMAAKGLDVDQLAESNKAAVASLQQQISQLKAALSQTQDEAQKVQLEAQIRSLTETVTLLQGNSAALSGAEQYLDKVSESCGSLSGGISRLKESYGSLDSGITSYTEETAKVLAGYGQVMKGISGFSSATGKLLTGSGSLSKGTAQLYEGVSELCDGASSLSEGTSALQQQTAGMDQKIDTEIDELLGSIGGGAEGAVSFISSQNTNVTSVQFVIKTEAIEKPEKQVKTEKKEELTFWQKLKQLFGMD